MKDLLGDQDSFGPASDDPRARVAPFELTVRANALLTDLLDALPAAVYVTDPGGRLLFFNKAAAALWGSEPRLGDEHWRSIWRFYRPDGRVLPPDECPMALSLHESRAIGGIEAIAERSDGTRVRFMAYPSPLRDENGSVIGIVNMLVDLGERNPNEYLEQRLAAIVESSDDAIVSKDLNGIVITWNRGAEALFGYTAAEMVGKSITILIPADRPDEEPSILERIRQGKRIAHYETVRRRKDGSLVDISLTVSPIRSAAGAIVGVAKIARDITERKRLQEQQTLLLGEMSHRVKNVLAVASGLVAMSARSAKTPEDMAVAIRQRLEAYTRAHELTRPGLLEEISAKSQSTSVHTLIGTIVAPYLGSAAAEQVSIAADQADVPIAGSAVTSLALVLHEFTTNAAKYGALSTPEGRVAITFGTERDEFVLTWEEHGGPRLTAPPTRLGFGTQLAKRTIQGQFGGHLQQDWEPEGVRIRLTIPANQLTATGA